MIEAQKSKTFRKLFHLYNKYWLLRRSFYSVNIRGSFPKTNQPMLVLVNHSNWWDGLVSYYVTEKVCHHDSYAMMGEEGMKKFPFFRKIGAFSVRKDQPRSILTSLNYAATLLEHKKAVWIFPQGEERHLEERPLFFQQGVAYLLEKKPETIVVPVTYYYTFTHHQRPELYIDIGSAVLPATTNRMSRKQQTSYLEQIVTNQLDQQKNAIIQNKLNEYRPLLNGTKSVSEWLQWLKPSRKDR
ncbi:lysophospholipid acyltransferase family protein [Halalkalibacter nanhaiisediminis]|uniref:Acyltransferase-like protein n=1 Tax=Halalkalibacter nanhaiisediminis TaxID=688079 RepID=A0A562QMH2_9BACI|nr:lysophospholipid acyltransferase family protein [Halalkalibacter nanhaiisediminis]TWI57952.1 acyltransferase-like protein [Halalkalibacter nanhaiisediminis]